MIHGRVVAAKTCLVITSQTVFLEKVLMRSLGKLENWYINPTVQLVGTIQEVRTTLLPNLVIRSITLSVPCFTKPERIWSAPVDSYFSAICFYSHFINTFVHLKHFPRKTEAGIHLFIVNTNIRGFLLTMSSERYW